MGNACVPMGQRNAANRQKIESDYLEAREEVLNHLQPQWRLRINEFKWNDWVLPRNGAPICIPPSWDYRNQYVGALDENADGYEANLANRLKSKIAGDHGEAEFLSQFQNTTKLGGILIGSILSRDLLGKHGKYSPEKKIQDAIKSDILEDFEIDFIYVHPQLGICQIEVKSINKDTCNESMQGVTPAVLKACVQLKKQIPKRLFLAYCAAFKIDDGDNLWQEFCWPDCRNGEDDIPGIVYRKLPDTALPKDENKHNKNWLLESNEPFERYWLEQISKKRNRKNFFDDEIFRKFVVLLCGYRPNFFISPDRYAVAIHRNFFCHDARQLKLYYKTGSRDKRKVQNLSRNIQELLRVLHDKGIIRHKDIDFGRSDKAWNEIYLTKQQENVLGIDDDVNLRKCFQQLIYGPPGVGKSLLLQLKIFLLGQMETRKTIKLQYHSSGVKHFELLKKFVQLNEKKYCRKVEAVGESQNYEDGADIIIDELWKEEEVVKLLSACSAHAKSQNERYISAVYTGYDNLGIRDANAEAQEAHEKAIKKQNTLIDKFKTHDFEIVALATVFRSSVKIQQFFHQYSFDKELISGHNFCGVLPEFWTIDNVDDPKIVIKRLDRLVEQKVCNPEEICVLFKDDSREIKEYIEQNRIGKHCNNKAEHDCNVQLFKYFHELRSLEFAIMLVVDPSIHEIYLATSRAVCHLIIFQTLEGQKYLQDEQKKIKNNSTSSH